MKRVLSILLILLCTFSFAGEIETRECIEQWNLRQIGVREQGYNLGQDIEYYIKTCGFRPTSQISYCACYVLTGMKNCNVYNLPNCASWASCWFTSKKTIYIRNSRGVAGAWKTGDLFALYDEQQNRIFHMGFVLYVYAGRNYIITTESNVSDAGNTALPGEGTHAKKRSIKQIYMIADYISTITTPNNTQLIYHIVQKKETLYRIAIMYNVTVNELLAWNPSITDNIISLEQKLIVKK